ncbi:MAG: hypothetical protein ING77_17605 [Rhodocyclaceae bacterium]|nr:hypothetical protein [Rhodocyclaceae bacterium]MCA3091109.1 hypothetical protein [Rhodocyclaceae bacterium]MCA3092271.1 hypothetical protein [Rhodocyclaceae bacterium]MCA3098526.1 hypothetical protein [Rhodocyclaceae bacterium]MCA3104253.1 hypothetical protein [Rhodocyclaceae bacterium]
MSPTRLGGAAGSSGGLGELFGSILKTIGFRANSGSVTARGGYIVGKRGPEFIVPNNAPGAAAGMVVNVNVQAHDVNSFRGSEAEIAASLPATLGRAQRRNG